MRRGIYQTAAVAVSVWLQHAHASASSTALPLAMGLEQVGRAITGPVTFWLGVISLIASGVVLYIRGEGFDSFGGRLAMAGLIFGGVCALSTTIMGKFGLSSAVLPW
jgi:type IV secretory pathway VirB2 component (pilin)